METSKNDKLIQKLRSTSPSVVYQTLVEIRTKEVNSANGVALLRKRGALKYFVKFLQKPNEKILDITLSILGNCCLENETRLELWRLGAVGPIVRILEGVGKDSIQGRTCRVLGNLAQLPEVAAVICQEGAVSAIVGILGTTNENNGNDSNLSSISESTKQMAVRALRVLAVSPEYRLEILNQGGARAVAELLTSTNEELQKAAMKALVTLTQHCSEECANQVQGDGACFERLVSFVWDPNLADESCSKKPSSLSQGALTCLANLARVPEVRPKLGNAGAINAVVNQLRHASNLDLCEELKLRDLVSTLCLFCRESVNRMKLRDYGGLNQLLIHLKDDKHGPVAAALCNFAYDELGFRQLVECGLIQICADRLRDVISVKLKENGRRHTFLPLKNEHLPKKLQVHRSSFKVQKSRPGCIGVHQQVSMDDCAQNTSAFNHDQKVEGHVEESSKKLLKSPMKTPTQKTFRISSPSYQAVRHEQEGLMHCNLTCSSPPSATNLSSTLFSNTNWSGSSCGTDCSPVSSSLAGSSMWPGSNSSFSLSGFFQAQGPVSPMPINIISPQFQEGLLSPEASSCCSGSGGSSSSCTSGYASSPRSDLSDAPSPSSGTTTTNDSGEVYSPVYEDGSDDSGEEDLETKDDEEKLKENDVRLACSKRLRKEDSFSNQDFNELKAKKKCSSLSEENIQTSLCSSVFNEAFLKAATDGRKFGLEEKLLDEGVEKMAEEDDEKERQGCTKEENEKRKTENSLVCYLLVLLSYASQLDDPIEELASHNTFSALLDYHIVNQDPAPRATRILTRIVRNEHYLIPLINQRFVIMVRSSLCLPFEHREKQQRKTKNIRLSPGEDLLSQWKQCSECIRLKSLGMSLLMDLATSAESGFGEGELAYGLLKGDDSNRMAIALSLPFIIRVKKILRKLLLSCNGFMVLLDVLRDHGNVSGTSKTVSYKEKDKEEYVLMLNAAVDGLSYLANAVGISLNRKTVISKITDGSLPYKQKELLTGQKCLENGYLNESDDKVVVSLDDGTLVNASREGLSSISPVFRAMLQGDFLESKEGNLIKLPGVSHFCFNYILHHLGECSDVNCLTLNSAIEHSLNTSSATSSEALTSCLWAKKPEEVYSALELVSISDRFLLPDAFRKKLANQVLDWYLCPESAAKIYMWCIGSEGINGSRAPEGLGLLEGTLKYILVGDMTLSERVTLIKSVFDVGLGEELLSDMNDIIRMFIEL